MTHPTPSPDALPMAAAVLEDAEGQVAGLAHRLTVQLDDRLGTNAELVEELRDVLTRPDTPEAGGKLLRRLARERADAWADVARGRTLYPLEVLANQLCAAEARHRDATERFLAARHR